MYLHMYTDSIQHCEGTCTYAHTHKVSMISGSQKKCQEKQWSLVIKHLESGSGLETFQWL